MPIVVNRPAYDKALHLIETGIWGVDAELGEVTGTYGRTLTAKGRNGYRRGSVWIDGRRHEVLLHRVVWESVRGTIPDVLQINHVNGRKSDNRIANLELVTSKGNIRHAIALGLRPERMSFCRRGLHEMSDSNVYVRRNGSRWCRACRNASRRARHARMTQPSGE